MKERSRGGRGKTEASRNKKIMQLVDKGWTYTRICEKFGLKAKSTISVIYNREKSRS